MGLVRMFLQHITRGANKKISRLGKPETRIGSSVTLVVRMAIQNFLKNPVTSMVLGLSDSIFSCNNFKKSYHSRRLLKKQSPFFIPILLYQYVWKINLFFVCTPQNKSRLGCFPCEDIRRNTERFFTEKQHFKRTRRLKK